MIKSIKILTLGCPKNIVDSEKLAYNFKDYQIKHIDTPSPCDILIINTCGFIIDAKKETINTILDAIELKNKNKIKKIFVIGCLVQGNKNTLQKELPEIDNFFEVNEYEKLIKLITNNEISINNNNRIFIQKSSTAYLKIAEGCNRKCSFCIIPLIKGKYKSQPLNNLIEEAKYLADNNIKEIILVAQDTTYYGYDLYKKSMLTNLLIELEKIEKIKWIRILYAYPQHISDNLLNTIAQSAKICKYIDIPIQHISNKMLKLMRRNTTKEKLIKTLYKLREKIPDIAIRTTVIVGHPYETEKDFNELLKFIEEFEFDKLGVFKYSHEEHSYSYRNYNDNVPESIKNKRYKTILEVQQKISSKNLKKYIGTTQEVLIESKENEYYIGRTQFDAPEIDGITIIKTNKKLKPGNFYNVEIVNSFEYDLEAII